MENRIDAIYARQSVDRKDSISIESQIEFCKYELNSVKPRLDLPLAPVPYLRRKNGGQIFNRDGSALERGRFQFSVIAGSGMRHILSSCVNDPPGC